MAHSFLEIAPSSTLRELIENNLFLSGIFAGGHSLHCAKNKHVGTIKEKNNKSWIVKLHFITQL